MWVVVGTLHRIIDGRSHLKFFSAQNAFAFFPLVNHKSKCLS